LKTYFGFILVCVEAVQYIVDTNPTKIGGLWNFPQVVTDETGPRCTGADSLDNVYMDNVIAELDK
jgi:hypothetical protein